MASTRIGLLLCLGALLAGAAALWLRRGPALVLDLSFVGCL